MTPGPGFERGEAERELTPDEMARAVRREQLARYNMKAAAERLMAGMQQRKGTLHDLARGLDEYPPEATAPPQQNQQRPSEIAGWCTSLVHAMGRLENSIADLAGRLVPVLDTSPLGTAEPEDPPEAKSELGRFLRERTLHAERLANMVEELISRLEV